MCVGRGFKTRAPRGTFLFKKYTVGGGERAKKRACPIFLDFKKNNKKKLLFFFFWLYFLDCLGVDIMIGFFFRFLLHYCIKIFQIGGDFCNYFIAAGRGFL